MDGMHQGQVLFQILFERDRLGYRLIKGARGGQGEQGTGNQVFGSWGFRPGSFGPARQSYALSSMIAFNRPTTASASAVP